MNYVTFRVYQNVSVVSIFDLQNVAKQRVTSHALNKSYSCISKSLLLSSLILITRRATKSPIEICSQVRILLTCFPQLVY